MDLFGSQDHALHAFNNFWHNHLHSGHDCVSSDWANLQCPRTHFVLNMLQSVSDRLFFLSVFVFCGQSPAKPTFEKPSSIVLSHNTP